LRLILLTLIAIRLFALGGTMHLVRRSKDRPSHSVKRTAAIFCAVLALQAPANMARADEPLRIASEGFYPPFNFFDAGGNLVGFDIDIARLLCEVMNVQCELTAQDWDALIPGLLAGDYDAVIASMSITEARKKQVAFSNPYYSNALSFVGDAQTGVKLGKPSLQGKAVGVQASTISADYLAGHWADVVRIEAYETQQDAFRALERGEVDLALGDLYAMYGWLETESGKAYQFIGDPIDIDDKIGIAVRKEDEALRHKINEALAVILADGRYTEINLKYFPFDIY